MKIAIEPIEDALHAGQLRVLREAGRFNVLECGRRFGKTHLGVQLAIDVAIEELIHHELHGLMAGRTTIVIAHRLSTINLAERVVFLANGKVVADGTHEHLMATEPRYVEALASAPSTSENEAALPGTAT